MKIKPAEFVAQVRERAEDVRALRFAGYSGDEGAAKLADEREHQLLEDVLKYAAERPRNGFHMQCVAREALRAIRV